MRWMFREQLWGWSAGGRGGCDGLHLAAGVDLDALGLGLFGLGDQDAQHPVLHRSLDLVRHDLGGQGDRAAESAGGALDSVVLLLRGLAGELALALDGQQAVLQEDLQVVELDPWQLDGHQIGVGAFGDVQRWRPGRGAGPGRALPLAVPAKGVGEQAVHLDPGPLLLRAAQVLEGIPLGSKHHLVLPRPWAAAAAAGSGTTQSGCVQRVHLPSNPYPTLNTVHLSRTAFTYSPAERGLGERPRRGCGTCRERPETDDTLSPSRTKPPATAGPIGPPAPQAELLSAATAQQQAQAGPQLSLPEGRVPSLVGHQDPERAVGGTGARPQDRGAVVDQDMLVEGGGGLPGPDRCPGQAA